jgi:hypothetical protein
MPLRRAAGTLAGALLLALSAPAVAGSLATGIVFVGDDPNIACRLINVGPKPVTIQTVRILGTTPGSGTLGADMCSDTTLAPDSACVFNGNTATGHVGAAAEIKGRGKTLRGVCFLTGSSTQLYLEMR